MGGPLDGEWRDVKGTSHEYVQAIATFHRPPRRHVTTISDLLHAAKNHLLDPAAPALVHRYHRTASQRFDYEGVVEI